MNRENMKDVGVSHYQSLESFQKATGYIVVNVEEASVARQLTENGDWGYNGSKKDNFQALVRLGEGNRLESVLSINEVPEPIQRMAKLTDLRTIYGSIPNSLLLADDKGSVLFAVEKTNPEKYRVVTNAQ